MIRRRQSGFTLVEYIVVIGIVSLIAVGLGSYVTQGMRLWNTTREKVAAQEQVQAALKDTIGEIREMLPSDNGSYPLVTADGTTIEFYANVDGDVGREKIKYSLVNGTLFRWSVKSDGGLPPQYPAFTDNDRVVVATNIVNTGPVFTYYDNTYNGETAPLVAPFDLNTVSLVQAHLIVDENADLPPESFDITTSVSLRNLKYKYEN